ncbi:MAG: aminotransferase class III-fold pyridoxal phosphate-dependent enzyme, partial [Desulfobacteraceae bacterium]
MNLQNKQMDGADAESGIGTNLILEELLTVITHFLPQAPDAEDKDTSFLELGLNSLSVMEMIRFIDKKFKVKTTIPQFFNELTTPQQLADYILLNKPENPKAALPSPERPIPRTDASHAMDRGTSSAASGLTPPETSPFRECTPLDLAAATPPPVSGSAIENIMRQQLVSASEAVSRVVSQVVAKQLEYLNQIPGKRTVASTPRELEASRSKSAGPESVRPTAPIERSPDNLPVPPKKNLPLVAGKVKIGQGGGLTEKQQRHLNALIGRFVQRTRRSKEYTDQYRPVLADSRATVEFRLAMKEMLYPIVGQHAEGARIWDLDGNEYIDLTMGFGVLLFGHNPPFIVEALKEQISHNSLLGPRSPHVGELSALISEFTGFERVTYCNSGTESVMASLRLARAFTKKEKIVIFEGAYHGHSDLTLAISRFENGRIISEPVTPGTCAKMVQDIVVLKYGDDESLEWIRKNAHELAAVIVEPIQSRRPDLQPKEFLQALRKITAETGVILIFDEMITGFRVHPGGAQAWFGVKADIATYGKLLGGGMPIGVIAGKAKYMDGIDGGLWHYGDDSYPMAERVYFGGTFCQHPLAMAAGLATMKHLKAQGPGLQQELNRRTEWFAKTLNDYFNADQIPIKVVYFGSLFRFVFYRDGELLFYHLITKGIYVWEWRNCFISTAHTDQDLQFIITAIKESIADLREAGFLQSIVKKASSQSVAPAVIDPRQADTGAQGTKTSPDGPVRFPMTEAQKHLWILSQMTDPGALVYTVPMVIEWVGPLDERRMRAAFQELEKRHEIL